MFKRPDQSGSTKQLRRTKLIDNYKNLAKQHSQTQHHLPTNRIMLTDLCPEEKAKIGDLVKTLQARKKENQGLSEKLKEMASSETSKLKKIEELEKVIQQKNVRQIQYKEQLEYLRGREQQRQKYIAHLNSQIIEEKQMRIKAKTAKVDQFTMTDQVFTNNQGIQAVPKRKKQKQKEIQTQEISNQTRKRNYPNTSKSYEKIMRGKPSNSKRVSIENSINARDTEQSHHHKSGHKKSKIKISGDSYSDDEMYDQERDEIQHQDDEEEEFDELARKWLELKQNNMSKIKESYSKSKEKFEEALIPREFEDGMHDYEEESFGPHKRQQRDLQRLAEPEGQFDEVKLNRMLKSKNFSASRLMSKHNISGSRLQSEESLKKSNKRDGTKQRNAPTNNLQKSNASNSRNIDFYETDLLEIVNSINPK